MSLTATEVRPSLSGSKPPIIDRPSSDDHAGRPEGMKCSARQNIGPIAGGAAPVSCPSHNLTYPPVLGQLSNLASGYDEVSGLAGVYRHNDFPTLEHVDLRLHGPAPGLDGHGQTVVLVNRTDPLPIYENPV